MNAGLAAVFGALTSLSNPTGSALVDGQFLAKGYNLHYQGSVRIPFGWAPRALTANAVDDARFLTSPAMPEQPDWAASYLDFGFYFFDAKTFRAGSGTGSVHLRNLNVRFDSATSQVFYGFDYDAPLAECDALCLDLFALDMNYQVVGVGSPPIETFWFNPRARRLEITASQPLDRIDVHAVIAGRQYNHAMSWSGGRYIWSLPPNVEASDTIDVFFNYDFAGRGADTRHFALPLTGLAPWYAAGLSTLGSPDHIVLDYSVAAATVNLTNAYVHFRVNGGEWSHYAMTGPASAYGGVEYHYDLPDEGTIKAGDVVDFWFTYSYDGVPYNSRVSRQVAEE